MTLEDTFVLPARDAPGFDIRAEATGPQRAGVTGRPGAQIAQLDPAAGVGPWLLCRTQHLAGRATVDIGARVVAEVFAGEAALLLELSVALIERHIGFDTIVLAGLQVRAAGVAGIGQHLQGL